MEFAGFDPDAFEKNRAIEDRRNEDRFHFIDWCKTAFKNVEVIPPGSGIMHQINLEECRRWCIHRAAWPFRHLGRYRQPRRTSMRWA